MFLGIDIGSSSSKAVVLDTGRRIVARAVKNIGIGTAGPDEVMRQALELAGISEKQILYTVATGYGRNACLQANRQITEISCHGKGISYLLPGTRTVVEIGGQDAKVIRLSERGTVENFAMNEKCAAGTGRFLEVMARILNCGLDGLAGLSEQAKGGITISNTCTVFAESEVISQLAEGRSREDVALGIHQAIAKRVAGLGYRVGILPGVAMSGGVALNTEVVRILSEELGTVVTVAKDPQTVGALGAALYAFEGFAEEWKHAERKGREDGH